ncbi:hypothetical protein NP233_g6292 [Leucocoprinus birnbaumii]|uniref:Microbial-type PARG catalytic domain-containing protein n=1 Tax=Leucocoprinus birnbaumii TaxID=56174 RepID=A0AAD5YVX2_9AGAR|nr:hypothetical protein NP233_g6292 [Leucocoprinus birnbaumii]
MRLIISAITTFVFFAAYVSADEWASVKHCAMGVPALLDTTAVDPSSRMLVERACLEKDPARFCDDFWYWMLIGCNHVMMPSITASIMIDDRSRSTAKLWRCLVLLSPTSSTQNNGHVAHKSTVWCPISTISLGFGEHCVRKSAKSGQATTSWPSAICSTPQQQSPEMPSTSSNRKGRELIAQDTLDRIKTVIKERAAEGATEHSTFYSEQLPPLQPIAETKAKHPVLILNSDAFTAARRLLDEHGDAKGSVAVLNLASDETRAGGWLHSLSRTQEEALCYSSTLYSTLKPSWFPWPNRGPGSVAGGFSPGVVIFKNDLDNDCVDLPKEQWRIVSVITVAAPRWPKLTAAQEFAKESDLEDLRGKIRLVYRMAAHNKQRYLVLGAMGCGAYGCPPKVVANEMKSILLDEEFSNYFERVVFAVYSKGGNGNFSVFSEVFKGVEI